MEHTSIAAVVENGLVVNMIIVEVDDEGTTDFEIPDLQIVVLPEDTDVAIGHGYIDGEFTAPEQF
jgi:hypothetical protein